MTSACCQPLSNQTLALINQNVIKKSRNNRLVQLGDSFLCVVEKLIDMLLLLVAARIEKV